MIATRLIVVISALAVLPAILGTAPVQAEDTAPFATREQIAEPWYAAGSFRHMADLFPGHVVNRGGPVSELPYSVQSLADVHYTWQGRYHALATILARTYTTGFLVIKDGRIVYEWYFGGAKGNSSFTSWSVAKSFTSTLVGLALAEGKIAGIDHPVTEYLPELKGSGYDGVPIKDLLEMSSGVKFTEEYVNPQSSVEIMWSRAMVQETERLNDFAKSVARAEPPGTKFVYRSLDTQVLGWLVKQVTGESLAAYLSQKIWQPLGMEQNATWLTDRPGPDGMEAAYCCLNATLRDYGRFGMLFLNKGKWNGKQIVPEEWVEQATVPRGSQVQPGRLYPGYPIGYGYQWWTFPGPDHAYSAEGVNFQFIYISPSDNLVIVKTSAFPTAWNNNLALETYAAFDAIREALRKN
ncbi:MAG TPA: serine hydrolase [Candidatus Binataceae bacterium]|nr:serine hydrolase [Candidatus Binataceae bacterium]